MVFLVLVPLLLGVVAYRAPINVARGIILFSQLATIITTLFLLHRAIHDGDIVELAGGANRYLYIELLGTPISLALVLLTAVLLLAATICGLRHSTHKLLLLYGFLQGLMSGIFVTNDIFNLFVLLEVVTLVMVLLNVYRREVRSVYDALYYLLIQIVGMTFFLFGLGYLYRATGQLSMTLIAQVVGQGLVPTQSLVIPFALILTGLGLKIGLFPLFSYVPRFYGNPGAPISVLMLSSSLISTAALFWIWRVAMAFRPLNTAPVLLILGTITAIAGAAKALSHHDARLVLAFSTVSQAGLALVALGSGTYTSERGFIAHLFTHALAKALLFLAVGALVEKTHSSQLADLRQEVWRHPLVALSMVIGALSLIGIPLTAGGVSKYWIMSGSGNPWIEIITWVITLGTTLIMGRLLVPHHSLSFPVIRILTAKSPVDSSPTGALVTSDDEVTSFSSVNEPEPQPWSGPEAPGSADERYVAPSPQRFPVRGAIAATLAVMVALVLLAGMAGTNAMELITGTFDGVPALNLAVKALQLVALISVVGMLIWLAPKHRWWPQTSLAGVRETLSRSLALPDAFLAVAVFFAAVLIIAFLPGVL